MAARAEDSKTGIVASVVAHLGFGVGHIQPAHKAGVMPLLDDLGIALLRLEVLPGNVDLLLKSPQVDIVAPHVSHQGYEDVPAVFHCGPEVGGGGLEVAPRPPKISTSQVASRPACHRFLAAPTVAMAPPPPTSLEP